MPAANVRALHLPLTRTAIELGSERVANIVALGALAALTNLCDLDALAHKVRVEAPRSLVHLNLDALGAGIAMSAQALTTRLASPATRAPPSGGRRHPPHPVREFARAGVAALHRAKHARLGRPRSGSGSA